MRAWLSEREQAWLWGSDPTPGIVSVWADGEGRATIWRRVGGALVREEARFRPWILVANGADLGPAVSVRELSGPGELRYVARADDLGVLTRAVLGAASRRFGHDVRHLRDLPDDSVLALPPDEQYLVATGRVYFRGLQFDELQRLQFDLETTGLDPTRDRIFLVAVRDPDGRTTILEAEGEGDLAEARLIARLVAHVRAADPDVIENHNLHGFDLPCLEHRALRLGVPLGLGREGPPGLRARAARRGTASRTGDPTRRIRFTLVGREPDRQHA